MPGGTCGTSRMSACIFHRAQGVLGVIIAQGPALHLQVNFTKQLDNKLSPDVSMSTRTVQMHLLDRCSG